MMRRKVLPALIILVSFTIIGVVILLSNPLLRSEETIRNKLLKITPIGTKMEDVIALIQTKKEWKVDTISYEHGFLHQGKSPRQTIGTKSIRVLLGEYGFLLTTSVTVFWGFDENSKLVDIWVWQTTDAP